MTRVTIRVDREDSSIIKVVEVSAFPLHTDDQTAVLVRDAYVRVIRSLIAPEPVPPPQPVPPAAVSQPAPDGDVVADDIARKKAA